MSLIEKIFKENTGNRADYFDTVVGHIEDIVISDEFQEILNQFMENHWHQFEDSEENKIIYTDIFNEYTTTIENYIVTELNNRMEYFNMEQFAEILQAKKSNLEGEIFDLLFSLTDYIRFKEMILDYKSFKEGNFTDLSTGILVTSLQEITDSENNHNKL